MRRVLIVIVLVIAAAVLGLMRSGGGIRQGLARAAGMSSASQQGESRDEIRRSFQLQPGARVDVRRRVSCGCLILRAVTPFPDIRADRAREIGRSSTGHVHRHPHLT